MIVSFSSIVKYYHCSEFRNSLGYKQNEATFVSERFPRMVGAGKLRSCPPLASAETLFRFASFRKKRSSFTQGAVYKWVGCPKIK